MREFKFFQKDEIILWRKQNGVEINIQNLTLQHIGNIQNCLLGLGNVRIPAIYEGRSRREWLDIFTEEIYRRNERL